MTTIDVERGPVVRTTGGRVRGTVEDGIHVFRGIPYAEPPVGRRRFRPPEPRAAWDGVRDAGTFGEMQVQRADPVESRLMSAATRPPEGPDCLNLNVWTPDPGAAGLPVMFWIHGGSLTHGTGADVLYDGGSFARDGIVVVTINYRLHAAGYLYVAGRPGAGAFGVLDQIAALTWVRENIAGFGGDPDRVTVAGESAGAHSVGQLLAAPAARGLFRRAVLQSGACSYDTPVEASSVLGAAVLDRLGVRPGDDDAIAGITDDRLVAAYFDVQPRVRELLAEHGVPPNLMTATTGVLALSTYGGDVVPRRALAAVAEGAAAGVDLLIGTNEDEVTLFTPAFTAIAELAATTGFGPAGRTAEEVLAGYRAARPGSTDLAVRSRFLTDTMFRIPAIRLAEAALRHHDRVFSYSLAWASPPAGDHLGAFHGLDLPLMFAYTGEPARPLFELAGRTPPGDLVAAVHGAWAAFVIDGVPAHAALPTWPAYDTVRRATMVLDDTSRVVDDPHSAEREIWHDARY